jgi:hypothetical protein
MECKCKTSTNLYHWAINQLNNLPPSIEPTAMGILLNRLEMIKKIIADLVCWRKRNGRAMDRLTGPSLHVYKRTYIGRPKLDSTRELDNYYRARNVDRS